MIFSRYFVYIIVYSVMGWIWESIYCTINNGEWSKRGFLYGPLCPIYGFGAVGLTIIQDMVVKNDVSYTWWQVFLVSFIGSFFLEYFTSWALEKLFNAYWWDYSDIPLNINGRVCLPASLGFGVAGLVVMYGIAPATRGVMNRISPMWMELIAMILLAILMVDVTLTVSALTNFARTVASVQDNINAHMEQFVNTIKEMTPGTGGVQEDLSLDAAGREPEDKESRERERVALEFIERATKSMGGTYKRALKRVRGFKNVSEEKNYTQKILDSIRNKVKK